MCPRTPGSAALILAPAPRRPSKASNPGSNRSPACPRGRGASALWARDHGTPDSAFLSQFCTERQTGTCLGSGPPAQLPREGHVAGSHPTAGPRRGREDRTVHRRVPSTPVSPICLLLSLGNPGAASESSLSCPAESSLAALPSSSLLPCRVLPLLSSRVLPLLSS